MLYEASPRGYISLSCLRYPLYGPLAGLMNCLYNTEQEKRQLGSTPLARCLRPCPIPTPHCGYRPDDQLPGLDPSRGSENKYRKYQYGVETLEGRRARINHVFGLTGGHEVEKKAKTKHRLGSSLEIRCKCNPIRICYEKLLEGLFPSWLGFLSSLN